MCCRLVLSLLLFLTLLESCALAQSDEGGNLQPVNATSMISSAHADDEKKVEFKSQTVLVQVP
ncbi:MAG: hypothetical protein WBP70_02395, partial [Terriglobales bacterium]